MSDKDALDLDHIKSIIDGIDINYGGAEEEVTVEEDTPPELPPKSEFQTHERFTGVEFRDIDARHLFGEKVQARTIRQYRGFDGPAYQHISVPKVDPLYVPDIDMLNLLMKGERLGLKGLSVGDTGCGKTSLVEYYAAVTGRPFHREEFDQRTDDQKLFGSLELRADDGASETYHNRSALVRAMEYPSIICLDELSRGDTSQTMMLNRFLDRGEVSITSHKGTSPLVKNDPEIMVWFTDNTCGNGDDLDVYNAGNVLDQAIINRISLFGFHPYPSEKTQQEIISRFAGDAMSEEDAKSLAHFSAKIQQGFTDRTITSAFSTRNLIVICDMVKDGDTIAEAVRVNYYNRVAKSEKSDVAEQFRAIFGTPLV